MIRITAVNLPIRFLRCLAKHCTRPHHSSFVLEMSMFASQKLAADVLISAFATFTLSTTILAVSTTHWNVNHSDLVNNRTGLFQQCSNTVCCEADELDRSITFLALLSVILLTVGTLASFFLMATSMNYQNRCYILVPLTLFMAGIAMTLTLIQTLDHMELNGQSAYMFIIDTILAYILGGSTLWHAAVFYF